MIQFESRWAIPHLRTPNIVIQGSTRPRLIASVDSSKKKSISHIVRPQWRIGERESYALSKFQPPTTLGDRQNIENTIRKKIDFFWSRSLVFREFGEVLEELRLNGRQNQLQRQILLQMILF